MCTAEELEVLSRGSKKSEKLRQRLMGEENRDYLLSSSAKVKDGLDKAKLHKDKLLEYDRTRYVLP